MKKIDLSGGTTAGLVIGSVVIAAASMVISLVAVAGAQTEVDTEVPAAHGQHDGAAVPGAGGHGGAGYDGAMGPGAGGHGGAGYDGAMGPGAGGHDERLAATAEYLGLDSGGLKSQLKDGVTIAELAGDDLDDLIAQQLVPAAEHIGQAVAYGRIDQAKADEMLSVLSEWITARMNGEMPEGMGQGGMGHGGMGKGDHGCGGGGMDGMRPDGMGKGDHGHGGMGKGDHGRGGVGMGGMGHGA